PRGFGSFSFGRSEVKADGSFTVKNLSLTETYFPAIQNMPDDSYLKSVRVDGDEAIETGVNPNRARSVELVISTRAGKLDGNVTGSDGKPSTGATVVLLPEKLIRSGRRSGNPTANTDQYGHFSFRGLRPGKYQVLAFESADSDDYNDPDVAKKYASRVTTVTV